jgi:hypothetical protein
MHRRGLGAALSASALRKLGRVRVMAVKAVSQLIGVLEDVF